MDNLTHSLVGAVIAQCGLKHKTGLGTATLIFAANLPDIDAACIVFGTESLAMRRGLTHGPLAMLLLPLVLAWIMVRFDRWQSVRGTRPDNRLRVDFRWLVALAYIGCLSHPVLDWFNNYGIRLLSPFSEQWFYGDTLFIVDVWLWAVLGLGTFLSIRAERRDSGFWRFPAAAAGLVCIAYVLLNGAISWRAEEAGAQLIAVQTGSEPDLVVANAVPLTFWRRELLWQSSELQGSGKFALSVGGLGVGLNSDIRRTHMSGPAIEEARRRDADMAAFLFWARMPYAEIEERDGSRRVVMRDARFSNPLARDRFTVITDLP